MRRVQKIRLIRRILILMIVLVYSFTAGCFAQPTSISSSNFALLVRVQAKNTGQDIEGAEVTIEVGGKAPFRGFTDANGVARIYVDISFENRPGRLIVKASNYKTRIEEIDLIKDALPTIILLEPTNNPTPPEEPTPTEEPIPPPTNTPTPTEETTTEPTVESAIEPSAPTVEPTITPTPTLELLTFEYQVLVQAKGTEEIVPEAIIKIEISDLSLDGKTDANGLAKIPFDSIQQGQPVVLIIEAPGYKSYRQEIEGLSLDVLPDVIQLEPEPPLEYQIRVKDEATNKAVLEANVTLRVEGQMIFSGETDTSGVVTVVIEAVDKGKEGELIIEALDYQDYNQLINLENIPAEIALKPKSPPILPTGKLAIPLALDGKFIVYIVDVSGNLLGTVDLARQPDFTNDGTRLIVNGDGGPWDKLRLITQIGDKRGQDIGDPGLGGHSHPFWSPDGTQLIYDDNTIGGGDWRMFIRRDLSQAAGTGEELAALVGPILGQSPLWTDGDWFIFRGCRTWASQGGDCGVWKMQGNRGEPIKLTNTVNHILTDVVGNVVVYSSDEAGGGNWNVYTLNISTGQTNPLTFDPMPESLATLSPDGRWVAYLADQGGQLAVWRVSVNGGTPVKMFDLPRSWGYLTPDGWYNEKLSWGKN